MKNPWVIAAGAALVLLVSFFIVRSRRSTATNPNEKRGLQNPFIFTYGIEYEYKGRTLVSDNQWVIVDGCRPVDNMFYCGRHYAMANAEQWAVGSGMYPNTMHTFRIDGQYRRVRLIRMWAISIAASGDF